MDKQTPNKRPAKPFRGAIDGVPFSTDNQPSAESKRKGWEELRKERHLTKSVIKELLGDDGEPTDSFIGYIRSLVTNAKAGNAKAIETLNKCLEEDIQKIAQVDSQGNDVSPSINITTVTSLPISETE